MRLSASILLFFFSYLLPFTSFAQKPKTTAQEPFSYWFKGSADNQNFELLLSITGSVKSTKFVRGTCYFDKEKANFPVQGTYKPSNKEWVLQYTRPDSSIGIFILQQFNGKTATGKHKGGKKSNDATFELFPSLPLGLFMTQVETLFAEQVETKAPNGLICIAEQQPKSKKRPAYDQLLISQYAESSRLQFLHESDNTLDETVKIFGLQTIPFQPQPTLLVYTYENTHFSGEAHNGYYNLTIKVLSYQNNTWNALQDTTLLNERWDTNDIHYEQFQTNAQQISLQQRDKPAHIWEWNGKTFQALPRK